MKKLVSLPALLTACLASTGCVNVTVHKNGEVETSKSVIDGPDGAPLCDPKCRFLQTSQSDRLVLDIRIHAEFTEFVDAGGTTSPEPIIQVKNGEGLSCRRALDGPMNEADVWQPGQVWFSEIMKPTASDAQGWEKANDGSPCSEEELFEGLQSGEAQSPVEAHIELQTGDGAKSWPLFFETPLGS